MGTWATRRLIAGWERGTLGAVRISTLMTCVLLAAIATALGFACGAVITPEDKLPSAGSPRDDGTGVLARASSEESLFGLLDGAVEREKRSYGGRLFGGNSYGGTRYGNYQFDRGMSEWRARPNRQYQPGYFGTSSGTPGRVWGTVTWPSAPRPLSSLPGARSSANLAGTDGCDDRRSNDTLSIDKRRRVAGAIVYLEGIYVGREGVLDQNYNSALQIGGTLRLRACQFTPHVQVISPLGSRLRIINSERSRRTLQARLAKKLDVTLTVGAKAMRELVLGEVGFMEVRDERIASNAWVVTAGHPYYTVTDEFGDFRLYNVPTGSYTLVVWHEPVAVGRRGDEVVYTQAVEYKKRIEVRAGKNKPMIIKLPKARN